MSKNTQFHEALVAGNGICCNFLAPHVAGSDVSCNVIAPHVAGHGISCKET
jgi:hypothetical protein